MWRPRLASSTILADSEEIVLEDEHIDGDIEREPDGVVVIRVREGAALARAEIEAIMAVHVALAEGGCSPTLVDIRGLKSITLDARRALTEPGFASIIERMAVLVAGPASRVIGSFFLRVQSPAYPVRIFDDESRARAWLGSEP